MAPKAKSATTSSLSFSSAIQCPIYKNSNTEVVDALKAPERNAKLRVMTHRDPAQLVSNR